MLNNILVRAVVIGSFLGASPEVLALTTSEFTAASPGFQERYVFGIMEHAAKVSSWTDPKSEERADAYSACFTENKIKSREGPKIILRYLDRIPNASGQPMSGNTIKAFYETCHRYLER